MLTVLIATYNGENTLEEVLDAYCHLDMRDVPWKLTIVDNGSRDGTYPILKSYTDKLPLQILSEPKRGKNAALNTGLAHIEGDLVVFTDDDVLPDPDWLREFRRAADTQNSYSIFGGSIKAKWPFPPEEWILKWVPLKPTFGILDDIDEDGPIDNFLVFGGNMAIRSQIFKSGYRFDESIGPKGRSYPQGSETQLLLKLKQDGHNAWHCRNASVRHMIEASQMDRNWILKRAIRFGRGQYRLYGHNHGSARTIGGVPIPILVRIIKRVVAYGKARLSSDQEQTFQKHWALNYDIGAAFEARSFSSESRCCGPLPNPTR